MSIAVVPALPTQSALAADNHSEALEVALQGPWDCARLVGAWRRVQQHHAALRSRFKWHEKGPLIVIAADPSSAMTLEVSASMRLRLVWDHTLLDGRSARIVLADVARAYAGDLVASSGDFVPTYRAILSQPLPDPTSFDSWPEQLNVFAAGAGHPDVVERRLEIGTNPLPAKAMEFDATPAAVAEAAWLLAIADISGAPAVAICVAEDIRPPGHLEAVGMFMHVRPFCSRSSSLRTVVASAMAERRRLAGTKPVPLSETLAASRRCGHRGMVDCLVTVQPPASLPPAPPGLGWELLGAQTQTSYAIDVDVELGSNLACVIRTDRRRVPAGVDADLVAAFNARLEGGRLATARLPAAPTTTPHAQPEHVLAVCRTATARQDLELDSDLLVEGLESLQLMQIAAALTEVGIVRSVTDVVAAGTPRRIATAGSSLRWVVEAVSHEPTPFELDSLALESANDLGWRPEHEQSVLVFDTPFDSRTLLVGLRETAAAHRALLLQIGDTLTYADAHDLSADLVTVAAGELDEVVSRVLRDDIERGFEHEEPLFRATAVCDAARTALVCSWHAVVLDGWSQPIVMLHWLRAMAAVETGRPLPPADAPDIGHFRRWCQERSAPDDWEAYLGAAVLPDLTAPAGERRHQVTDGRLEAARPAEIIARAARAARGVLGRDAREPIGVRMAVRPPELTGSLRMVGRMTHDAPLLLPETVDPRRVTTELNRVREFRVAAQGSHRPFEVLVSIENYPAEDEARARGAEPGLPRQIAEWRRDVGTAPQVITFTPMGRAWKMKYSTTRNGDVSAIADELLEAMVADA